MANAKNVYGEPLQLCCGNTGFTREGFCYVPDSDYGNHSVCAVVDAAFLQFSYSSGNDLVTPNPQFQFPGLKPGDRWCLCARRWLQAYEAGVAPRVRLAATHEKALDVIPLALLEQYAVPS
ncbi:DUF2237 domain-containing protein [Alteromonas aestuariivivens]|uniref:DUF2237 domain-containing protein n=1 Tax=Alteromonas aestuariivivens TaxID=1938339 RepID=A0A3D8M7D0_9ALTE|nr:DUF2237 domain-containing protein [Alteromonas aestuariivivens]RDV25635.1 DUF2237 domain-containing protein [Alteromonas aestuariivivens]